MPTIFSELPQALTTALKESFNITEPMPVQTASFPLISEGRNLVLQSRTGSGKTLAYLLPLLAKLTPGESGNKLLIVAPTQELAVQIGHVVRDLNAALDTPYSLALIGGGANINHQLEKLKKHPQILVGTPGRILELFDRRKINGQTIEAVVFDEIDALLAQEAVASSLPSRKPCAALPRPSPAPRPSTKARASGSLRISPTQNFSLATAKPRSIQTSAIFPAL